jgi:hypothetical protein
MNFDELKNLLIPYEVLTNAPKASGKLSRGEVCGEAVRSTGRRMSANLVLHSRRQRLKFLVRDHVVRIAVYTINCYYW